eukprot:TRINITY_DN11992_c0_g1_i1.p1 TRINITY_DN11992_c0_g1~~TRINITY_DN11992_c0_g1_i1.p1  ORF type:complete len:233 (+),score=48.35 TRINITY_DN11992_c0_g1_i1:99-797(+)
MNILLFAPALLLVLVKQYSIWFSLQSVILIALIQLGLGYPFLSRFPQSYLNGAFEFGRVFMFKWTVNWKFLSEEFFVSKQWALVLLVTHISLLFIFAHFKFCKHEGGVFKFIFNKLSKLFSSSESSPLTAHYIVYAMFVCNFLGIVCARSLHYQFYSWYFHTIPFLLGSIMPSSTSLIASIARIGVLGLIEMVWNIYPARWWTSVLLLLCHGLMVLGLLFSPVPAPQKQKQT